MPQRGRSGIPNLYKKQTASCRTRDPLKCDCPWYGKYKGVQGHDGVLDGADRIVGGRSGHLRPPAASRQPHG
jgi:hypothetical protein